MKNKTSIIIILVATCVIAIASFNVFNLGGSGEVKLTNEKDSLAYCIGVDVGTQLMGQLGSDANYDLICRGLADAFKDECAMSESETAQFLQHYFSVVLPAQRIKANEESSAAFLKEAAEVEGAQTAESGLIYKIYNTGADHKVSVGDSVEVHYVLSDSNGKVLQSSKESGKAITYLVTPTTMIAGFTEGIAMLGEGGKADLYLPFEIAYGERGSGQIGPKQALKFEIEVLRVVPGEEE